MLQFKIISWNYRLCNHFDAVPGSYLLLHLRKNNIVNLLSESEPLCSLGSLGKLIFVLNNLVLLI